MQHADGCLEDDSCIGVEVKVKMMLCAVWAGILTVDGCLGDEGQESESGELCLGAEAHSYQQEAQHDESLITTS